MQVQIEALEQQQEMSASQAKPSKKSAATLHWLFLRTTALRHRLLEVDLADTRADVIRRTLIMWLFLTMTVTGRQRTCNVLASKLKSPLRTSAGWEGYEDALLWVLLTSAMSASMTDRHWFKLAIRRLLEGRQLLEMPLQFDGLVTFCKWFFYLDNIQEPMLRAVVNDLNSLPLAMPNRDLNIIVHSRV